MSKGSTAVCWVFNTGTRRAAQPVGFGWALYRMAKAAVAGQYTAHRYALAKSEDDARRWVDGDDTVTIVNTEHA